MLVSLDLEHISDIDALTKMLKLTFSNEDWQPMIRIADKLYQEAYIIYHSRQQQTPRLFSYTKSLIYYLGYSQLCKGVALQKLRRYREARECIAKYEDLSWMRGIREEEQHIVEDFHMFSIGNTYTLDLLEGNEEVLPDYIRYLKQTSGNLLAGMITIFESAIKNNFVIDWVLEELGAELKELRAASNDQIKIRYFTEYLYLFSLYKYKQQDYDTAISVNLEILAVSVNLKDNTAFKKMVALFESFRDLATQEQEHKYKNLLKTILEGVLLDEKDISLDRIHSSSPG